MPFETLKTTLDHYGFLPEAFYSYLWLSSELEQALEKLVPNDTDNDFLKISRKVIELHPLEELSIDKLRESLKLLSMPLSTMLIPVNTGLHFVLLKVKRLSEQDFRIYITDSRRDHREEASYNKNNDRNVTLVDLAKKAIFQEFGVKPRALVTYTGRQKDSDGVTCSYQVIREILEYIQKQRNIVIMPELDLNEVKLQAVRAVLDDLSLDLYQINGENTLIVRNWAIKDNDYLHAYTESLREGSLSDYHSAVLCSALDIYKYKSPALIEAEEDVSAAAAQTSVDISEAVTTIDAQIVADTSVVAAARDSQAAEVKIEDAAAAIISNIPSATQDTPVAAIRDNQAAEEDASVVVSEDALKAVEISEEGTEALPTQKPWIKRNPALVGAVVFSAAAIGYSFFSQRSAAIECDNSIMPPFTL